MGVEMIKLKMFDSARLATTVSAVALALSAMAPSHAGVTVAVSAVQGWNLLGYSDSAPVDVVKAFGDISKVVTVWKWDATNKKWAFYSPLMSSAELATYAAGKEYTVLTTINGGEGFWVNAKTPFTAILPAPAP